MADQNHLEHVRPTPDDLAGQLPEVADARKELIIARNKEVADLREAGVTPYNVPQSSFPERMRQGLPGMINRMVDYNAVTRSVEGPATGIPAARAVSQSASYDINCVLGGTVAGFVGITILDPTVIIPIGSTVPVDATPQNQNIGVLTKGEIFATASVATLAGDPVHFDGTTGVLTNTGVIGPVVGARWKYARPQNELNVVQLGIQR